MVDEELEEIRVLRAVGRIDDYLAGAIALATEHPEHLGAQIEAAYACDRMDKESQAIRFYDAAWELGVPAEQRRDFLVGYGSTLRNVGRSNESIARLREAMNEFPDFAALPAFLALSLHSAGRHAEALATALGALLAIGHETGALASYDQALRHYQRQLLDES